MNTQTKQNNMQPNKDYYGVKFPPIKQEQPNSNIEQAAKNESVRVVSEYYPFDRDEKWYKHGLALAENMFTKGVLWQQSQLPESKDGKIVAEAFKAAEQLRQSQEQEVKAVADAESEGWDMKHKPKIPEQIAAYVHEIDSLRETNRKLGEQIAVLKKRVG